jgi:hypothetical protein
LAVFFISNQAPNVAYWHKADIRGTATFCPLLDKNGQNPILARDALSVMTQSGHSILQSLALREAEDDLEHDRRAVRS